MNSQHLTILGGGPSGLAVAYYAKKNKIPFTVYEAKDNTGGNCITFKHGEYLFDSGAHRFHDKIPEITEEIKHLLDGKIHKVTSHSSIYFQERFIRFPLSPINLLRKLGFYTFSKAGGQLLRSRIFMKKSISNFKDFAIYTYGKCLAEFFLIGYSEKLWGLPAEMLSKSISGNRLKGLDIKFFLKEAFYNKKDNKEHLEGSFYYPAMGIGMIPECLEKFCGHENIRKKAKITRVIHEKKKIKYIIINNSEKIKTDFIVNTLPINLFLHIIDPLPPKKILDLSKTLKYRNVILIVFFLNKNSVSANASIYFPEKSFPVTRIYEPKNRSILMSPHGKTSLVAEIPCNYEDSFWQFSDDELINYIGTKLSEIKLINKAEIEDTTVKRLPFAYPVLEVDIEKKIKTLFEYIDGFHNLSISGRNGRFIYGHIHDMMFMGKKIINEYLKRK